MIVIIWLLAAIGYGSFALRAFDHAKTFEIYCQSGYDATKPECNQALALDIGSTVVLCMLVFVIGIFVALSCGRKRDTSALAGFVAALIWGAAAIWIRHIS